MWDILEEKKKKLTRGGSYFVKNSLTSTSKKNKRNRFAGGFSHNRSRKEGLDSVALEGKKKGE